MDTVILFLDFNDCVNSASAIFVVLIVYSFTDHIKCLECILNAEALEV